MVLLPENIRSVTINTGNILSLNDITKKPGQNPTEEVSTPCKASVTSVIASVQIIPRMECHLLDVNCMLFSFEVIRGNLKVMLFQLSEAIQITLKERDVDNTIGVKDGVIIKRRHDDLLEKITLYKRQDLKIGIKLFVSTDDEYNLREAINQGTMNVYVLYKL